MPICARLCTESVNYLKRRLIKSMSDRIIEWFFRYRKDHETDDPARQAGNTCPPRQVTSLLVNTHFEFCFPTAVNLGNDHAPHRRSLNIVYPLDPSIMKGYRLIWK